MNDKRLFTFGCSFTQYHWPTWADILGKSFDLHFNYGLAGAGNFYIFKTLIDAIAEHDIDQNDTVAIMWTTFTREDRFLNGKWFTPGNVFNALPVYDDYFLKNYCDLTLQGFYERDIPLFHAAQLLLDKIGCKHYILSLKDMYSNVEHSGDFNLKDSYLESKYKTTLDRIIKPAQEDWLQQNKKIEWRKLAGYIDGHPYPFEHLMYVQTIFKEYNITKETVEWVKTLNELAKKIPVK